MLPGGALALTIRGREWIVGSEFSGHRLLPEPDTSWTRLEVRKDGLKAASTRFTLARRILTAGGRVKIEDRITNTSSETLGLSVRHKAFLNTVPAARVRVAGMAVLEKEFKYNAPANPTVHVASRDASLGLVCEDDVFRNQAWLFVDSKKETTGFYTETLSLTPEPGMTLVWSLYPAGSPDYFDFINRVRRDWGSNYTVDGPWHVFGGTQYLLKEISSDDLKAGFDRHRFKYSFELGGWVDHAQDARRIGFGSDVRSGYWKPYREQLKQVIRKLKEARPEIKVLVYFDTLQESSRKAEELFADSLLKGADGRTVSTDYGGQFERVWRCVAIPENRYGKAMLETADYLVDELGADGLGWDEMELIDYGWPLMAYDMKDGVCRIADREARLVTLVSEAHRLAVIDRMRRKGKLIIGNSPPCTRKMLEAKLPRFTEIQLKRPDILRQGDLSSPLGFIGWDAKWECLLDCLRQARLPIVPRVDYSYEILPYLFPFTPRELHEGYLLGEERIITLHSGNYGWTGMKHLVLAHRFDAQGKRTEGGWVTRVDAREARTRVDLADLEAAVLERLPIEISVREGEATVRRVKRDDSSIEFILAAASGADLTIEGNFRLEIDGKSIKTLQDGQGHLRAEIPPVREAVIRLTKGR